MNVMDTIKANVFKFLCVILLTLLVALKVDYDDKVDKLESATSSLTIHEQANKRLSEENKRLVDDLEKKPKEVIKIVREVEKELCTIPIKQEAIKNLKSRKEVTDEKDTADIDDRLPADLIRLLQ